MLAHLADVSIRSLLLAAAAAIVLRVFRGRTTAAFEHAVWMTVVCGMLALLAFGEVLPRLPLPIPNRPSGAVQSSSRIVVPIPASRAPETGLPFLPKRPDTRHQFDWRVIVLYFYMAGAMAFLTHFFTGMLLARRLLRGARPIRKIAAAFAAYEAVSVRVPLTAGWFRPIALLPPEWRGWSAEKLDAVLAHEGAHIRRRDGLASAIAAINRCLFWFHPVAWVAERKLALLAEKACDECSVARLGDRERYANLLIEMARAVDSHGRLRRHAITMASKSHLSQRIDALLEHRETFAPELTFAKRIAIAFCGALLVCGAGAVELKQRQPKPAPLLLAQAGPAPAAAAAQQTPAQTAPTAQPRFDSASVRPCRAGDGAGHSGRGGNGGRGFGDGPGWLWVNCLSVREMVDIAYDQFGPEPLINDPQIPNAPDRIRGGPDWVKSDYYTIDAETNNPIANTKPEPRNAASMMLEGVMLRALLEDRFHLQTHREVHQVPMYALRVAASGLKLQPMEEGGCVPIVKFANGGSYIDWSPGKKPPCGWIGWATHGPNRTVEGGGVPLSRLAEIGDLFLDRHIVDQTGVTGIFNIHLEYTPDEHTPLKVPAASFPVYPNSDVPPAGPIFTAIEQQLGLELKPVEAPQGFIVIDHVERQPEN